MCVQGVIRKPRQAAGFRGTVRYAPIACHQQKELARKDDCETWLYMQVGELPELPNLTSRVSGGNHDGKPAVEERL